MGTKKLQILVHPPQTTRARSTEREAAPAKTWIRCFPGSRMRRHQFSVFVNDILNVTDVLVAQPKAGPITQIAGPFATLFCLNDRVRASQELNSAVLGSLSGLSVVSSADGLTTFNTLTLAIDTRKPNPHIPANLRGLHGTLNILGLFDFSNPEPTAIAGGTGSFLFAKGSITAIPIDIRTFNQIYRVDIDVYLPA